MAEYVVDLYSAHDGVKCERIVRCRDCKYYREHEWIIATDVCHFFGDGVKVEPDGFYKWGKRRTDG